MAPPDSKAHTTRTRPNGSADGGPTPLAAAAEGWLDAALASPIERISREARHHQATLSAEEALTVTFPRLLAQAAPLTHFIELAPHLKRSRIGQAAHWNPPPRESNPWLQVMRIVTEHGRSDVLRWLYSDESCRSYHFNFSTAVDDDYDDPPSGNRETYEDFGRQLATQCAYVPRARRS